MKVLYQVGGFFTSSKGKYFGIRFKIMIHLGVLEGQTSE